MKYIKYFETVEEYKEWMNEADNAKKAYESEEKICVDGVIFNHTYKDYNINGDVEWLMINIKNSKNGSAKKR